MRIDDDLRRRVDVAYFVPVLLSLRYVPVDSTRGYYWDSGGEGPKHWK